MVEQAQPKLSRELILDAALALTERDGIDSLSMRRLAQELDVWPMSVYRYFRDKEELLDAVAGSAAAEARLPARRGSWRSRLGSLLDELRRTLVAGDPQRFARAMLSPGGLRLTEAGVGLLREAGLAPRDAAEVWRALCALAFGFGPPAEDPGEPARRARAALAALPEHQFPQLTAARDEIAGALSADDAFERAVERMLAGIG